MSGLDFPRQLPAEAPLEMPVQRFDGNAPATIELHTRPPNVLGRRLLLISATAVLGLAASIDVRFVLALDGMTLLDGVFLLLFVPLVCWIAFGFVSSLVGFGSMMLRDHPGFTPVPKPADNLHHRTAVLMPVYNEDIAATFARVEAMTNSIAAAGGSALFDFFILSDSGDAQGQEEQAAWQRLARAAPMRVYYRRRPQNIGKKPGNIAEWVRRFGAAYEYMLVLDADSMMSGSAMTGLASIMENRPTVGLLQTVPLIINASTFFQHWMQFATAAYGPISSAGLLWWSGSEANFWGHNAIVRIRAFAACCGLPELPGKPPFGGLIQSHDMAESALMRRRGWAVHMVMIDGSYEEFPPTIVDHAIRDRRWAQGNLQHLRLLDAAGFHWTSRLHLLIGATAYLTSTAWLVLILIQCAQTLQGRESLLTEGPPMRVLVLTILYLFGPRLMAVIWVLENRTRRAGFGGAAAFLKSVLLETLLSMLLAPVVAVNQTRALFGLLFGVGSAWNAQNREGGRLSLAAILPTVRLHWLLCAVLVGLSLFEPVLGLWLSPIIFGLASAPWLITLSSSTALGRAAARARWFGVPAPYLADPARVEVDGDQLGLIAAK
ncbi:glucans biosynthesis glucosyltransferase H [Polymorphobacter glacialis]|uniref:Glucans biosynthesis glucosyltransferase H n=1 Tax=Sandarakinorhabdus glacialis TaxID=1614636 RepID=A0A916ZKS9_9SPHN|nr:glucans biosynthesis glucosyltransferase MdoH [Polymorphobacter glacialis]GGE02529.1 glucans biosynthesis glucosyltransferase H [Polymorphobacter glacialis]